MYPSLSTRLNLFGHETDFIDSRSLRNVDHLNNILIEKVGIRIHEGDTLATGLENILKLITQVTKFDNILIDFQRPCLVDRYDNRLIELVRWRGRGSRWRRLRNRRIKPLGRQRSDCQERKSVV